jgi:hypothetical protein
MKLGRWNKNLPITINNIILLTNSEFRNHISIKSNLKEIYDEKTISEIEQKLKCE